MGIPKFFRYISRRYPCLTESLKDYQIPEFDNLYLDMNGIIHTCSHPEDSNVCFRISEEKIFKDIFHYVEILFRIIQPQKLFFIAIDGVAPRAKMNHQRGRRFRAAKDAEVQESQARAKGIVIPKEKRFDSNCITPGTVFMAKFSEQMKCFITYKMSTDKLWQRCKIIFSGSEVPGEGEHKIMDYIRYMKSQPDYDINTRHCLYGLDADLVMLGLCTHEIHFTLLREEITLRKQKIKAIEDTKFCLLHLSILRDYIDHEFSTVKEDLPFTYDIEKIIDDWVLMGFLVGNDFIPNLPNLNIANGALTTLYCVYKEVLHTLGGYINEAGTLNLDRFERFMEKLSQIDMTDFYERHMIEDQKLTPSTKAAADMIKDAYDDDDDLENSCMVQFTNHKRDYYVNKLEYKNVDAEFLRSQAEGYVRAIQWNLHYYYNGCCSWSWYYPHHYAPYISDIKGFKDLKLEFELGEPFLPFQQLLAVLPSQSKDLLPEAFQMLLTEEQSPIIDYYPIQFLTDLNGKTQEWEAVVLIPFIDEEELHKAMIPHYSKLTPEEVQRNSSGPMYSYLYSEKSVGKIVYETHDIVNHAKVIAIQREEIIVPREKLVKGLCPGVKLDVYMLGFPTLQHIKHTTSLTFMKGNNPHKVQSMILHIIPPAVPNLSSIASELLGTTLYVHWPFLLEAQVVAVSNCDKKISLRNPQVPYSMENIVEEELKGALCAKWTSECASLAEVYKDSLGIEVGETTVLIHARALIGKKYIFDNEGKLCLEKQWSEMVSAYPYQVVVRDLKILNKNALEDKSIETVFTPGNTCFMLGHPHYGSMGKIDDPAIHPSCGRIRVALYLTQEPSFEAIQQCQQQMKIQFMHGSIAAQRLGISSHILSRVTGTIYVIQNVGENQNDIIKHNIGLNLKLNKKNQETPGYTRRENGQWLYSTKAIDLIRNYMVKCPKLFERFAKNVLNDMFVGKQLFDNTEEMEEALEWLKETLSGIESRTCGTDVLDPEIVQKIESEVDAFLETNNNRYVLMSFKVKPHLLFMPNLYLRNSVPDQKSENQLFDRVCCVKESSSVPFGTKGTIIGIEKGDDAKDAVYDILFDKAFPGGLSISGSSEGRAYRLSVADFLNISYGKRKEHGKSVRTDLTIKSKVPRKSVVNQKPQSHVNASAFASFKKEGDCPVTETPGSPKLRIIKKNTEEPNKNKQVLLPSDSRNWRQPNSQNMGKEPRRIVAGIQNNASPGDPQKTTVKPTSEFHALWNELHKKQNAYVPTEAPLASSASTNVNQRHNKQTAKEVPKYSFQPQDPSEFLKAVLKISDNSQAQPVARPGTSNVVPPKSVQPTNEASNASRLVQQLFDHARQNEKAEDEKSPIWYCSKLLNYYQVSGVGMPRYSYFMDAETELIRAHILLPDTRIFVGDPCVTHEKAAGSAAKKAYMELNLTSIPDMKTLLLPPQQWYSNRQNVRPPVLPMYPPKINTAHFSQWTPKMPQNPGFPQSQMMHPSQSTPQPNRIYNEQKCEVKNSTSFVPLQAQKKSRNISAKQSTKDTTQCAKDNNHQPDAERKKEEAVPKSKKIENVQSPRGGEPVQSVLQQVQQKTEQSAKPKRSRVAAKFGTITQPE